MGFYNEFIVECARHNIKPSRVAQDIGLSKASVSNWKNGGTPTDAVMMKLATYFGISYDVIKGWKIKQIATEANIIGQKNEQSQKIELQENARKDLKILFDMAMDATPQEVKSAIAFFEALKNGNNH